MRRLDDRTLENVAEVICGKEISCGDQGTTVRGLYRTGPEIHRFLSAAGVEPPPFSGTRKWWTLDVLRQLNRSTDGDVVPAGIERVLLRLVDAHEYLDNLEWLPGVRNWLNSILVMDGIQIDWHPHARQYILRELPSNEWAGAMEELAGPEALARKQLAQPDDGCSIFDQLQLHPLIREVSGGLYRDGHYAQAILEAFKAVNNRVKEKAGRTDLDGRDLMAKVFRKEAPILKLAPLVTPSDIDEQEGFMLLFMGATVGIRNPKAHDLVSQRDPSRTLEYLAFASLLCHRVDDSTVNA
jgi:uncharacterized protein (TIGR02391 family)